VSSPTASKEKDLAPKTNCFNESFTTMESTWCLSDPGTRSCDYWDADDASFDYSIDEEVHQLTSLIPHRLRPARPTSREGFDADFPSASIPMHVVVPSPRWLRGSKN
jgi:hypothetical protein